MLGTHHVSALPGGTLKAAFAMTMARFGVECVAVQRGHPCEGLRTESRRSWLGIKRTSRCDRHQTASPAEPSISRAGPHRVASCRACTPPSGRRPPRHRSRSERACGPIVAACADVRRLQSTDDWTFRHSVRQAVWAVSQSCTSHVEACCVKRRHVSNNSKTASRFVVTQMRACCPACAGGIGVDCAIIHGGVIKRAPTR